MSDVSNNGVVRNIHGLVLDEPIALVADNTRIINYNWRGQGMSSVFLDGSAGDLALGNTATTIDWPAATQAETYFAPSPDAVPSNNAKRWLGTFVANGQGTTGMLYRRNRYFDPKSGQFTQADPTGIATGMNVFGFADGDPVNYSDPFGLCPTCENEAMLRIQVEGVEKRTGRDVAVLVGAGAVAALGGTAIMAGTAGAMGLAARAVAGAGVVGRIPNGEIEKTFETAVGAVRILGEAASKGTRLTINNFMVYPDNAMKLKAGPAAIRAGLRGIEQMAREAGYSQVIVNYNRTSGANVGKIGQKIIDLIQR